MIDFRRKRTLIIALAANIVSFSAGTAFTWGSSEIDKIKASSMYITTQQGSWINSLFLIGAMFGTFVYGFLATTIGRRLTVIGLGIPLAIGYILMAFVELVEVFFVARFITGLAVGGACIILPMYVGEIADRSNRGVLVGLFNTLLCLGMLFSYSLGPYTNIFVFNIVLSMFPLIFIVLFTFISVESPRYLLSKHKKREAKYVLVQLRDNVINIDDEITTIEKALVEESRGGLLDIFKSKGNIRAFLIGNGLLFFQQFSGIMIVFTNAQSIFQQANTPISPAVCSILTGAVQVVSSLLMVSLVDRLGRKVILLCSAFGIVLSEVPLGVYSYLKDNNIADVSSISFLPIICLVVFILTYNMGFGSIPWTMIGEIYASNVKSIASSINASLCYLYSFFLVYYFDSLINLMGLGPCFWIFSAFSAASIVFVQLVCIETKAKTLEEIQEELNR